jgi:hypothetical protein
MTDAQLWRLVHDTILDAQDYRQGDMRLVDAITGSTNYARLCGLCVRPFDHEAFVGAIRELRDKYRGERANT